MSLWHRGGNKAVIVLVAYCCPCFVKATNLSEFHIPRLGETMRVARKWHNGEPVASVEKQKSADHFASRHPGRLIENLHKVLASAEELIVELEEQGHPCSDLIVLKLRAAIIQDEINELSALID